MRLGLHVCRGNWSTREDVLISGDYTPLAPCFASMNVRQFMLEYCTPRAGELAAIGPALGADRELGLGVVNPRTTTAEDPATIVARVEEALQWWSPRPHLPQPRLRLRLLRQPRRQRRGRRRSQARLDGRRRPHPARTPRVV